MLEGDPADYLGVSLLELEEAAIAAREVIAYRLAVIANCDQEAWIELHRAVSEKISFVARWSIAFVAEGWFDADCLAVRMIGDMKAEILGNRDRLLAGRNETDRHRT